MRQHGDYVNVNFGTSLPVNVCSNTKCSQEFIVLSVKGNGDVWEQLGNGSGLFHCPYCREKVGKY